jgi:hypothetical protein
MCRELLDGRHSVEAVGDVWSSYLLTRFNKRCDVRRLSRWKLLKLLGSESIRSVRYDADVETGAS